MTIDLDKIAAGVLTALVIKAAEKVYPLCKRLVDSRKFDLAWGRPSLNTGDLKKLFRYLGAACRRKTCAF